MEQTKTTRWIAVTGGVCSSLGKGILTSALGVLLKSAGYRVTVMKLDPYLNVDPGTMSPREHGEVFVTMDGAETDLDLGHYERILEIQLTRASSVTSGQIFQAILERERSGAFLGGCITMVPHVVDEICERVKSIAESAAVDVVLIEVGGTVGDIEGSHFLEAIRRLKIELKERLVHCHLSLVPFLQWTQEYKTKPTQHSVMQLKRAGLVPDFLFLRADDRVAQHMVDKLALLCGMQRDTLFQVLTFSPMYQLFLDLQVQGVAHHIQRALGCDEIGDVNLQPWHHVITRVQASGRVVKIGLIAKYTGADPYISVIEAIKSAGYAHHVRVEIVTIIAEHLEQPTSAAGQRAWEQMREVAGIVVPGGFDIRGVEGKIAAARFAREMKIPYLGLCLGLQVMLIECTRSLLNRRDAHSTEFDPHTTTPVIGLLEEQHYVKHKGASMRLGTFACHITPGTCAHRAYQREQIFERHRHRYEFNNDYREALEAAGVVFSGVYRAKNLVEIAELAQHPFMVGVQFHPEFQSSPLAPHPLFGSFVQKIIELSITSEQTARLTCSKSRQSLDGQCHR